MPMFILFGILILLPFLIPVNSASVPANLPYKDSRFIYVSGIQWHCRFHNAGDSSKGNIILIHGFSGSTFAWRKTFKRLIDEGYTVVAPDLPPYGFSERADELNQSSDVRALSVMQLAEQLQPKKQWIVVGHSMGGAVATSIAAINPEKTSGLVIVDGLMPETKKPSWLWLKKLFINKVTKRYAEVLTHYFFTTKSSIKKLLQTAYGREPEEEEIMGYLNPLQIKGTAGKVLEQFEANPETIINLKKIDDPILIIWGEKDEWVKPDIGKKSAQMLNTQAPSMIPGAAHCPMETHPEIFERLLLDFCTKTKSNQ